jgi:hypothetical protein
MYCLAKVTHLLFDEIAGRKIGLKLIFLLDVAVLDMS